MTVHSSLRSTLKSVVLTVSLVVSVSSCSGQDADVLTETLEAELDSGNLRVSTSSERTPSIELTAARLSGEVYIFASGRTSFWSQVDFFLDDPNFQKAPQQVEKSAPFDFASTRADGAATAFDLGNLTPGTHSVSIRVTRRDGRVRRLTSQFIVTSGPAAPTPTPTPPSPTPTSSAFPNDTNTGVPAGTVLSPYSGPCTITTANTVIDSKTVNCDLTIRAANVVISRSKINGSVATDENSTAYSFTISDSTVDAGNRVATGVGAVRFKALRVHVTGGNRSMHCYRDCEIQDSYVHGQFRDDTGVAHESGIRMGSNAIIRHNTILCDAPDVPPDAGCSADLTGYGDFAVVENNLIENNLFKNTTGGYCTYGGSSKGKPFSAGTNNIRFIGNTWEKGRNGKCGAYGPITSFDANAPGNVWSNNQYQDGTVIPPAN